MGKKPKADAVEAHILKMISKEIEQRFNCEVITISLWSCLGTPNVMVKIKYKDDFIYKPCEHWKIDSIVFSERSVRFSRRIDFFDCIKNLSNQN
jgi:hypothetical protein